MYLSELVERINAHIYAYGDLKAKLPQCGDDETNPLYWNADIEVVKMERDAKTNEDVVVIY